MNVASWRLDTPSTYRGGSLLLAVEHPPGTPPASDSRGGKGAVEEEKEREDGKEDSGPPPCFRCLNSDGLPRNAVGARSSGFLLMKGKFELELLRVLSPLSSSSLLMDSLS